ncbi:MAG: DUF4350 domain-containing protein [Planctomycetota bacterium]
MKGVWPWVLAALVAIASVAAFVHLAIEAGRGGETTPLYSVRRFDPYGTAALYRLMDQRLETVTTLERPRLEDDHRGVLVQALPTDFHEVHMFTEADELAEWDVPGDIYALPTEALLDWVAAGNTLVQLSRGQTPVMTALGIDSPMQDGDTSSAADAKLDLEAHQRRGDIPEDRPGFDVEARWHDGGTAFAMSLREPRRFADDGPEGWTPSLRLGRFVYGGVIEHGAGRVVLVGAPTPALNHHLGDADHLAWWLDQIGEGPVVFDEWAHGIGHAGTILETLAYLGLVPLLLQTGLWLGVYRWSTAGRVLVNPEEDRRPPRTTAEEIDTLARLYDQAWDDAERRRRVYDEVVTRLADACRCRPDELSAKLKARDQPAARSALGVLQEARSLAASNSVVCPKCGYELRGSVGDQCPECGEVLPRRLRQAAASTVRPDPSTASANPPSSRNAIPDLLTRSAQLAEELRLARRS